MRADTPASELCGARDGETEVTCCCLDTINNRRLFSLIKEQRRVLSEKGPYITSAVIWRYRENYRVAGQFFVMSCDLPILRRDRLVDRDRRIEQPWSMEYFAFRIIE